LAEILSRTVDDPHATYYEYDVAGIRYVSLVIPAVNDKTMVPIEDLVEIHECQANSMDQRQRMIEFLERICLKRWGGYGCHFHDRFKKA